MKKNLITAYLGLVLMTTIIGFSFIFVKIALRSAGPLDLLAHRFATAALVLLLYYLLVRRRMPKIGKRDFPALALMAVFYPILLFGLQTIGLKYTTASEAGILSAMAPVLTLIFAALILNEKSRPGQIISVLVSVSGVIFILFKNGMGAVSTESLKGDFFILLSVLSMALYFVLGRKMNRRLDAMDITFFMIVTAAIVFNVVVWGKNVLSDAPVSYFASLSNSEYLWSILYLGVLSSFLTSFLTNNALKEIPASRVAVFNNLSPVITVFAGVLILQESLQLYHYVGGALVILGIIGVNILRR